MYLSQFVSNLISNLSQSVFYSNQKNPPNHRPTNMANHEPTIMANKNNQKFGTKMQSRERNQNFRSHAIRGYSCE